MTSSSSSSLHCFLHPKAIAFVGATERSVWSNAALASLRTLGYAGQLYATSGWTSLPWLHRISAPTLVLTGGRDPIVPPVNARILGARIPGATVQIVPDTGHLLLMDHAEDCAERISDFLREPARPEG